MSRPPNHEFQEWWNKQRDLHTNLTNLTSSSTSPSTSTNPNFLSVEIRTPDSPPLSVSAIDSPFGKDRHRSRNARQLSFFYLLKFQQFRHYLSYILSGFFTLVRTVNRRILTNSHSPLPPSENRFYRVIRIFLVVVLVLLCFELVAYFKGWHFRPPSLHKVEVLGFVELIYASWLRVRADYLAPPLQNLSNICIVLFLVQSLDRMLLMLGCLWIKLRRIKPVAIMEYTSDTVVGDYPMVLVQIPMCNEREHYFLILSGKLKVAVITNVVITAASTLPGKIPFRSLEWHHRKLCIVDDFCNEKSLLALLSSSYTIFRIKYKMILSYSPL